MIVIPIIIVITVVGSGRAVADTNPYVSSSRDCANNDAACVSSTFDHDSDCDISPAIGGDFGDVERFSLPNFFPRRMEDADPVCSKLVIAGECTKSPEAILSTCTLSCVSSSDFGSIGWYSPNLERDEGCKDLYATEDVDDGCEYWADLGECQKNPDFMLEQCAKSCLVCIPPG